MPANRPEFACFSVVAAQARARFRAVRAITRSPVRAARRSGDRPRERMTPISRRFSPVPSRATAERLSAERGGITFAVRIDGRTQMAGQNRTARRKVTTILGVVLAFAGAANAASAQTQATTTNGTQASGDQGQSAAALAQQASNHRSASPTSNCKPSRGGRGRARDSPRPRTTRRSARRGRGRSPPPPRAPPASQPSAHRRCRSAARGCARAPSRPSAC